MPEYYILEDNKPVPCKDLIEWGEWMSKNDRTVKRTERDGILVSTVFLGLNHAFHPNAPPLLFESMVFPQYKEGKFYDTDMDRYHTWEEALEGHEAMCRKVFGNDGQG